VPRLHALGLVAALLATLLGCASWRAERARHGRLEAELGALRYARPLDEVWLEVRRLLADRGFPLAGEDAKAVGQDDGSFLSRMLSAARETRPIEYGVMPGLGTGTTGVLPGLRGDASEPSGPPQGLMLETGWHQDDRYRAEAFVENGGIRVVLTRFVREGQDPVGKPSRDLALELELARRVEPDAAARIEAAAAQAAAR
jgi:hypothetical protein